MKRVLLLRHGQAMHNPRAEAARAAGCTFDEFLQLMEEDDVCDAELTTLGTIQATETSKREDVGRALRNVDLIISSPLSRALQTADLIYPPPPPPPPPTLSNNNTPTTPTTNNTPQI